MSQRNFETPRAAHHSTFTFDEIEKFSADCYNVFRRSQYPHALGLSSLVTPGSFRPIGTRRYDDASLEPSENIEHLQ